MNEAMVDGAVYQYKFRLVPLAWLLCLTPLVIYLGIASIFEEGWFAGGLLLLIFLVVVLTLGWVLIIGLADIVIDDEGISRRFFGAISQRILWANMARIHISSSTNPEDGLPVRSFLFVSSTGIGGLFSKRITFQERKQGMSALLSKMKICANQHGIQMVDVSSVDRK
jgi:hypothetical protein